MPIHCHKLDSKRSKIVIDLDECFQIKMILTADEIETLEGHLLDMQIKLSQHRRKEHPENVLQT
jgi:hypothetical protein